MSNGDRPDGLAIWTSLKDGGWIHHSIPDSEHPLTNGNFRVPFFRHGFDWSPMDSTGAQVEQFRDTHVVRISLSGEQRDHCVSLEYSRPLGSVRAAGTVMLNSVSLEKQ